MKYTIDSNMAPKPLHYHCRYLRLLPELSYQQGDRALDLWHCQQCACTTHWTAIDPSYGRMAENLRMFEPALLCELPRRLVDGPSY